MNIMEELSVGPDQDEIDALVEGPSKKAETEGMLIECRLLGIIHPPLFFYLV